MLRSHLLTVTFAVLSLVLFKLTFEGCQHSFGTYLARKLFAIVSLMYYDGKLTFLLTGFSYLGQGVSTVLFFQGVPKSFYRNCYPFFRHIFTEAVKSDRFGSPVALLRHVFFSLVTLTSGLLNRPMNQFHLLAFIGVMVTVRLFFFVLTVLCLVFVVKYFSNLLGRKRMRTLIIRVLVPSFSFANLLNYFVTSVGFSYWYLGGLVPVSASLFCSYARNLLKQKKK